MALSLDEVHDLIDSWELDPDVDTVGPATELFVTMDVGDPGRLDVLHVIADHRAMRGEVDAAGEGAFGRFQGDSSHRKSR